MLRRKVDEATWIGERREDEMCGMEVAVEPGNNRKDSRLAHFVDASLPPGTPPSTKRGHCRGGIVRAAQAPRPSSTLLIASKSGRSESSPTHA